MYKQFGLILPGQHKKVPSGEVELEFTKPSIFDESSSESDGTAGPLQIPAKKAPMGPSLMERRKAKNLQDQALAEDPTIFQYDELFDEMESKRQEEKQIKSKEPKKARYVSKLMEAAERRKLENELRVERQVQKEREAEGDEFKDKEAFVTSAYRKKLEEMRKLEEQNKRDDYLETIGDVTKQKDLDGFYRHIYEQKMGSSKSIRKPELQLVVTNAGDGDEGGVGYKPITSGNVQKQRKYRKRKSSEEENDEYKSSKEDQDKKIHLTNNIDADSDFSIDDSSSESESEVDKAFQISNKPNDDYKQHNFIKSEESKLAQTASNTIALNLENQIPEKPNENQLGNSNDEKKLLISLLSEELSEPKQKFDKNEVWRKRTVGDMYIAAVQRYCDRKAVRNQA